MNNRVFRDLCNSNMCISHEKPAQSDLNWLLHGWTRPIYDQKNPALRASLSAYIWPKTPMLAYIVVTIEIPKYAFWCENRSFLRFFSIRLKVHFFCTKTTISQLQTRLGPSMRARWKSQIQLFYVLIIAFWFQSWISVFQCFILAVGHATKKNKYMRSDPYHLFVQKGGRPPRPPPPPRWQTLLTKI